MDRHLKERLIGAGVLIAAAIVLIPEMLSGPKSHDNSAEVSPETPASGDAPKLKTYTIDLSQQPASTVKTQEPPSRTTVRDQPLATREDVVATATPPQEDAPSPATETPKKPSAGPTQPAPAPTAPVQPPQQRPATIEKPVAAAPRSSEPTRTETAPPAPGWTVQVGSFGVRATSERLANELRTAGFSAFVVAFQSGAQTMYRVRVGPVRDRAGAEALLRKVKSQHPNATLVAPQ